MKNLLICYDYFFPGYKAGGPIQSLVNLVNILQEKFNVSVFTGAYDLNENTMYDNIKVNDWNCINLPGIASSINVWYADTAQLDYNTVSRILITSKPDIIYINSIYSIKFMLYPLLSIKKSSLSTKTIICPRGMLQKGALEAKSIKKKIFLNGLKWSSLLNNVSWHATNEEEKKDITKYFPINKGIFIASNIPKQPYTSLVKSTKENNKLRLVYLSLISKKKNLHLLLKALTKSNNNITLYIYGPIKDYDYWETECLPVINMLTNRVSYKGDIIPIKVQETILKYDALVLLTMGENFGHALYESLSVGRPIITSYFTPWTNLEDKKAGWNIDITQFDLIHNSLDNIAKMENELFNQFSEGAYLLANQYYYDQNFIESYKQCFY